MTEWLRDRASAWSGEARPTPLTPFDSLPALVCAVMALMLALAAVNGPLTGDPLVGRAVQATPGGAFLECIADVLALRSIELAFWATGALVCAWRRDWAMLACAGLALLALGANPVLKEMVARDRPLPSELILREPGPGYGFPSGHVMTAALLYGYAVAAIAPSLRPRFRAVVVMAFAAVLALIGFDGAHWPSDVAGGLAFAGVILAALPLAARAKEWVPALSWEDAPRPARASVVDRKE